MKLEILSSLPATRRSATPMLFVHGAYVAAWCWGEYFLPYFSSHGYAAHAVSLRGHGASDGHDSLHMHSLDDYVEDLRSAVRQLEAPPVLVGHSMGGIVVQRYLERFHAPAAILMASVPPSGLLGSTVDLMRKDPAFFHEIGLLQYVNPHLVSKEGVRRALFSPDTPDAEVAKFLRRGQRESYRAIMDMTWPQFRVNGHRNSRPPMLVLGGERDAFFNPDAVRATARFFGAEAEIFAGMAHAMMLESRWQQAADRMLSWLSAQKF
jgi:non-heme chloroperoxidase